MKLLVVIFAIVLVAQLADTADADFDSFLNDMIEAYEEQQNIENNDIATQDIPTTLRSCTNAACYNICRRLGFRTGRCISANRYRCTRPIISRRCTNSACNTLCRRRGFRRGVCISSTTCRCYR